MIKTRITLRGSRYPSSPRMSLLKFPLSFEHDSLGDRDKCECGYFFGYIRTVDDIVLFSYSLPGRSNQGKNVLHGF